MKMKFICISLLLAFVAVLTGCRNDDPEIKYSESEKLYEHEKGLANAPINIVEKEDLPTWLSEFIDGLKPDNARTVAAYQGKWKGTDVYYVHDDYFSCFLCATFRSDGEKIDWSENDPYEFWESSKDWVCIYLSEFKISDN